MDYFELKTSKIFSIILKAGEKQHKKKHLSGLDWCALSNYSYPITESCNWVAVIGHPRDGAPITWVIGARMTNYNREFCYWYDYWGNRTEDCAPSRAALTSCNRARSSREIRECSAHFCVYFSYLLSLIMICLLIYVLIALTYFNHEKKLFSFPKICYPGSWSVSKSFWNQDVPCV